jgi:hypothetical protein
MWELDHLAVTCAFLDEGTAYTEAALGVPLLSGGQHVRYGTHNRLMGLGEGLYLEVIAPDPRVPAPPYPRWFALDHATTPRLSNWIVRTPNLIEALAASPAAAGEPVALSRGDLGWTIAVPPDGSLPHGGGWPTLIQWTAGAHPSTRLPDSGLRLTRLEIHHPDANAWSARMAPLLPDPRLVFVKAEASAIRAAFATPDGERWLG